MFGTTLRNKDIENKQTIFDWSYTFPSKKKIKKIKTKLHYWLRVLITIGTDIVYASLYDCPGNSFRGPDPEYTTLIRLLGHFTYASVSLKNIESQAR